MTYGPLFPVRNQLDNYSKGRMTLVKVVTSENEKDLGEEGLLSQIPADTVSFEEAGEPGEGVGIDHTTHHH